MKQQLNLSASIQDPKILESVVLQLAQKPNDGNYIATAIPKTWQAMKSSNVETYINGTIDISGKGLQSVHLPFTSSFLFCCTREKHLPYQMRWCNSLS